MIRNSALTSVAHSIVALLIVVATLALYVPIAPIFPSIDIDGGWAFALNAAIDRGLVFGRDLFFTFGPFGPAYTGLYHPRLDRMVLLSTSLLGAAFASGLLCLTTGLIERLGALLLVVCMGAMARDSLFFALPLTLLLLVCRIATPGPTRHAMTASLPVRSSLALLVTAMGLLPLVKGTFAAASGMVMALSFGLLLLRGQKAIAVVGALLFAVSIPVLWRLVGQPLAALPGFFISQGPIVSGYTDAMSTSGELWLPTLFISGVLLLVAFNFRPTLAGIVLTVGSMGLSFFVFKGGFVRADSHMLMAGGYIAIMASMLAFGRGRVIGGIGVAAGLIVWLTIHASVTQESLAALPPRIRAPFANASTMLVARIMAPTTLDRLYADRIVRIASEHPLPQITGTTDVYSYGQSIVLSRGMDWTPRPVLQSYLAYTPSLAMADAAFLASSKAAQNILFSVQPIDGRLGALEDGPSWAELLNRYVFADQRGDIAILRRRAASEPITDKPIADRPVGESSFHMGDMVALPAGTQPLWAKIDVSPTWLGKLASLAFRLPLLSITYRFADGHQQAFRYIANMGAAGFLVSPLVTSTTDFVSLALPAADDYMAAKRPQSFTISSEPGWGALWQPTVTASFFQTRFPSQPGVGQWLFDRIETEAARPAKLPTTADCAVDLIDMRRPQDLPVRVGKFLQVDGWAAVSVKDSLAPDVTSVTLTAPDGVVTTIRAKSIARDDVNTYFQKPNLGQIGYTALADMAGLGGDYMLGLRITKGERSWSCTTQIPVRIGSSIQ